MSDIISFAAEYIRSPEFRTNLERQIVSIIRDGKDDGLTLRGFVLKMAVELLTCADGHLTFTEAKRAALDIYAQFLADNKGVRFGDAGWDWSGRAARILAHEYHIDHWEPA